MVVSGQYCLCYVAETRVLRTEQIIMGTSGTVLDWILKRRVRVHTHTQAFTVYYQLEGILN